MVKMLCRSSLDSGSVLAVDDEKEVKIIEVSKFEKVRTAFSYILNLLEHDVLGYILNFMKHSDIIKIAELSCRMVNIDLICDLHAKMFILFGNKTIRIKNKNGISIDEMLTQIN
uniref:Uncharacterized protein n=1 Tax=Wuchereria bancrofti TaxID=6293 RepID=A0A1I8ESH3_WUCBA